MFSQFPGPYGASQRVQGPPDCSPGFIRVSTFAAPLPCDLGQAAASLSCGFSICAAEKGVYSPAWRGSWLMANVCLGGTIPPGRSEEDAVLSSGSAESVLRALLPATAIC